MFPFTRESVSVAGDLNYYYYINVFAESKLQVDALNYTLLPIYADRLHFAEQKNLLEWCHNEFHFNSTTGLISSWSCPEYEVALKQFLIIVTGVETPAGKFYHPPTGSG